MGDIITAEHKKEIKKITPPILWYPLIKPTNLNVPISELEREAKKLVDRFMTRTTEYLFKEPSMDDATYHEMVRKDLMGRIFLRMAASKNPRLIDWLVEFEGDEFYKRFEKAPFEEKISVLRILFNENVLTKEEFKEKYGIDLEKDLGVSDETAITRVENKLEENKGKKKVYRLVKTTKRLSSGTGYVVAIRFEYVPTIVSERRALLYRGWVIAPLAKFRGEIKKTFESKLRKEIQRLGEKVQNDPTLNTVVERFSKELLGLVKTTAYSGFEDLGEGAYNEIEFYPPCAYDLRMTLEESGYLPHNERLQLGLILKKLGMDVQTQLRFWYERAVDNTGLTYDQFLSKAGYQIKHLYGLVGSGTDYDAPKCETIISSMYCTFKNRDLNSLQESIINRFKGKIRGDVLEKAISEIISLSHSGKYRQACAVYLSLLTGRKRNKPISHPLQFFKLAKEAKKKSSKNQSLKQEIKNKQANKQKQSNSGTDIEDKNPSNNSKK